MRSHGRKSAVNIFFEHTKTAERRFSLFARDLYTVCMKDTTDIGIVEDVHAGTKEYIRRRWGETFYTVGILLGVVGVFGFFSGLGFLLFPAFLWFGIGWTLAYMRAYAEFMRQFAEKNNFSYTERADVESVHGDLFERGDSRTISHVVSGTHEGLPVRFFLYTYSTGSGKNRSTHHFTVAEVTFNGHVPPVLVDTKDDWYAHGAFGTHKKLSLGNAFDEHFTFRVAEEFETEALEVFTPEVMEGIMAHGSKYSFEFVDTHVYVWKTGHPRKTADLRDVVSLAQYLITTLADRLARLHDDVDAIAEKQQKK